MLLLSAHQLVYHRLSYWIEVMIANSSVVFSGKPLAVGDILPTCEQSTVITIQHCTSGDWSAIGNALSTLPQLHALSVLNCSAGDSFYEQLVRSRTVTHLHICTMPSLISEDCVITSDTLVKVTAMRQLEALTITCPNREEAEPPTKAQFFYERLFVELRNLQSLVMPSPSVKEIKLSTNETTQIAATFGTSVAN